MTPSKEMGAVVFWIFVAFFLFALINERRWELVPYLVIVFSAIAICRIGRPKPVGFSGGRTRRSLKLPNYVHDVMIARWFILVILGLTGGVLKAPIFLAIGIAGFIGITEFASRRYHKENPVEWEIAFHNEVDGYYGGDDGDGDGD